MGNRSGHRDLVVTHRDVRSARRSIERLSRAGIDGGAIVLLGSVEAGLTGPTADRRTDLGTLRAHAGRALRTAAVGAVAGAVLGIVVFALATEATAVVLAAGAAGGAGFGASVGLVLGLLAQPTMAGTWERTFAPLPSGTVTIGVRIDDARSAERAREALRGVPSLREVSDLAALPPAGAE